MRGVLQGDGQTRRCEVTFDGVEDFLNAYRTSLSHGGLFVPCDASAPTLTPVEVTLRLPTFGQSFQLDGMVVVSRPDGIALDLQRSSSHSWPELDSIGGLCDAISNEIKEGAAQGDVLPPMTLTPVTDDQAAAGHGRPLTFSGRFGSVAAFLRRYYSELGLGRLRVRAAGPLPTGVEFELRLIPPHRARPISLLASVKETQGDDQILQLNAGARFRAEMDAHVSLCEAVWGRVSKEMPLRGGGGALGLRGDGLESSPSDSELVEAMALLSAGFTPPGDVADLMAEAPGDDLEDIPTVIITPEAAPSGRGRVWGKRLAEAASLGTGVQRGVVPEPMWRTAQTHQQAAEMIRRHRHRAEDDAPPTAEIVGAFPATSVVDLLTQLSREEKTGSLAVHYLGHRVTLRFYDGRVGYIAEEPQRPEHRLSEMLLAQGVISPTEKEDLMSYARSQGVSFFKALVELDVLSAEQALDSVREQLRRKLLALLDIDEGRFAFYPEVLGAGGGLALSPVAAIFNVLKDDLAHQSAGDITHADAEHRSHFVCRVEGHGAARELELSPTEQRLWDECITGRLRLAEVYRVSPVGGSRKTHGVLFALKRLGYLRFDAKMGEALRARQFHAELQDRVGATKGLNHFQLLDLHWSAVDEEVVAAHQKLRERYAWRRHLKDAPPQLRELSDAVVGAIDAAREALSSPSQRRAYRRQIVEEAQINFAAELLVRQGDAARFRKSPREAMERYAHALELIPHQPEVAAKLKDARRAMLGVA